MGTRESTVKLSVRDNFSRQLRDFADALDHADRQAVKVSTTFREKLGQSVANFATNIAARGVSMLGDLAVGVAQLGISAEQTEIAFTTLTGSAEEANKHLAELRDFASKTPFEFTQLTQASRRLQAFGFEASKVVPMLTDIGDAVSAMGGSSEMIDRVTLAIGQMSSKGKVSAQEMLQLTEAGIPAWRFLADAIGVTTAQVQKMSEKGLIPADQAIQAILAGMRQDFGGMMAKQAETAGGQLSNLADSLTEAGTAIGKELIPFIKAAIPLAIDFAKSLKGLGNTLRDIAILTGAAEGTTEDYIRQMAEAREATVLSSFFTAEYDNVLRGLNMAQAENIPVSRQMFEEMKQIAQAGGEASAVIAEQKQIIQDATQASQEYAHGMTEADFAAQRMGASAEETNEPTITLAASEEELAKQAKAAAKQLAEEEEALRNARDASADAADGFFDLAQAYADGVTKMDQVKTALDVFDQAQRSGLITDAERRAAQERIMLQYGLTTEAAISQARAQEELTLLYNLGKLSEDAYLEGLLLIPGAAKDGSVSMGELGSTVAGAAAQMGEAEDKARRLHQEIASIPAVTHVQVIYDQIITGAAPTQGAIGGRQFGGPVSAGIPFLVGEAGRELFMPNINGAIIDARRTDEIINLLGMIVGGLSRPNETINMNMNGANMADIEAVLGARSRAHRQTLTTIR